MQDADRPAYVERLAEPLRSRSSRVDAQPLPLVLRPERVNRIGGDRGRSGRAGERPAVRTTEAQLAVGQSLHIANGSGDGTCATIASIISQADTLLAALGYNGAKFSPTTESAAQRALVISLKTALDNYNNGKGCAN
jgi:hypothetical protein